MAPSDTTGILEGHGTDSAPVRDIYFACPDCQGELVVDREGAGLTVPCSHCGHGIVIPDYETSLRLRAATPAQAMPVRQFDFEGKSREDLDRRFNDLKNQLKENQSQDTEMRGHVNRATMELHRLQLKLKKLQDRRIDVDSEINALADWLDSIPR